MDELLLRSHELRDDPAVHYNCAQGVFIPFAEKKGLTKQQAFYIAQNFGGGMRADDLWGDHRRADGTWSLRCR